MRYSGFLKSVKWLAVIALLAMAVMLIGLLYFQFSNWDIQGRLTQTVTVVEPSAKLSVKPPAVRLVLHRLLPDENAVEVSAVLTLPSETADSLRRSGVSYLTAEIRDGNGIQEYSLATVLKENTDAVEPGLYAASVETQRFNLPFYPSIAGFPFDEVLMRIGIMVYLPNHTIWERPTIEVQKAIPGRAMKAKDDHGFVLIALSRGPMEKMFVLLSAGVFILLSLVIGVLVFMIRRGISGVEGIVAMAGLVLASAGFRDFLGVPKATGVTALEIATFGIPFVFLITAILFSALRAGVPPE